jgi:hypothetical protein
VFEIPVDLRMWFMAGTLLLFMRAPATPPRSIPAHMSVSESGKKGAGPHISIEMQKSRVPIQTSNWKFFLCSGTTFSNTEVIVKVTVSKTNIIPIFDVDRSCYTSLI